MKTPILEMEGTWEEVAAHGKELAGRRVRLVVLPEASAMKPQTASAAFRPPSTANSLLKYAGTWEGDDLQECLEAVINSRLPAEFDPD